jgi:hypothetical protein
MRKRLGEILVDLGVISEEQLQRSLEIQRETGLRIGEILVEIGAANALHISGALTYQKQLLAGIAIATGLGLGFAAVAPQSAGAAEPRPAQTASQHISVSVPQILEVDYTGNPVLAFAITDADIRAGYKTMCDRGDVLWRTNQPHWVVRVEHSEWNSQKPLQLYVKNGEGADPSDKGWTYIDEGPTRWMESSQTGRGRLEGVDWMVLLPVSGLPPGLYLTTVTFTIESAD